MGVKTGEMTKSTLLNEMPKKLAQALFRLVGVPGKVRASGSGCPPWLPLLLFLVSCSWQPSWVIQHGHRAVPFQVGEWGQHSPHQDPQESNPDQRTCGRSLTTGVWPSCQACRKVWVAGQGSALHAHLRNLISSPQPLGSRLKPYFTLLRKCGLEVLPLTREAHSRAQLLG